MAITTIIFDWGGVLAPDNNYMAAKELTKKYDIDIFELLHALGGFEERFFVNNKSNEEYYKTLSKRFNIPAKEIKDTLNKQNEWEIIDFAKKLKKKKYNLYLHSDQMKPKTDAIIHSHHVDFFDKKFFSNDLGYVKTQKESFIKVLHRINKKPEECVFIDDRPTNIETARSVGINGILFDSLLTLIQELKDKYNISIEE